MISDHVKISLLSLWFRNDKAAALPNAVVKSWSDLAETLWTWLMLTVHHSPAKRFIVIYFIKQPDQVLYQKETVTKLSLLLWCVYNSINYQSVCVCVGGVLAGVIWSWDVCCHSHFIVLSEFFPFPSGLNSSRKEIYLCDEWSTHW